LRNFAHTNFCNDAHPPPPTPPPPARLSRRVIGQLARSKYSEHVITEPQRTNVAHWMKPGEVQGSDLLPLCFGAHLLYF
jgi:hypothetical protein